LEEGAKATFSLTMAACHLVEEVCVVRKDQNRPLMPVGLGKYSLLNRPKARERLTKLGTFAIETRGIRF
jgi:hypothetical protein